jgi:hypothetical protein
MPMGHEPTEAAARRVFGALRETTQAMRNLF